MRNKLTDLNCTNPVSDRGCVEDQPRSEVALREFGVSPRVLAISLLSLLLTSCMSVPSGHTPPSSAKVTLENFKLAGELANDQAIFTLTATANIDNPKGATLDLLEGTVALTELGAHDKWRVRAEQNRFLLEFDRGGKFAIKIKF